jgi:hypothetical protein
MTSSRSPATIDPAAPVAAPIGIEVAPAATAAVPG